MFSVADFNAIIWDLYDAIFDCDTIPTREILDKTINQHGRDLIDFLNGSICCVLNERSNCDNYTSISRRKICHTENKASVSIVILCE